MAGLIWLWNQGAGGSADATATPATVAAVAAVPAPTVLAAAVATPAAVAGVAAVPAPTVKGNAIVTPAAVAAIAAVPAPTVIAGAGVVHDAVSESHTGSTSSTSEGSFGWTHTPSGTPKGVLVYTFVGPGSSSDHALSVTYGGVNVPAVTDGRAVDTSGEPGDCKAWFLGSGVPTGAQTVTVTRTNNAASIYAVCVTVTASTDTETYGVTLLEEDQALAEQSITDGSPGTNSMRYAGVNSGLSSVPTTGANSTALASIDYGTRCDAVVRETTSGQGARSVGFTDSLDDVAAVLLAIREVVSVTNATATPATVAAIASVPAPTVVATNANVTVSVSTVAAVAAVPAPTVKANAIVIPATVAAVAAVPAPTISGAVPPNVHVSRGGRHGDHSIPVRQRFRSRDIGFKTGRR
jgi:hypothetical protein